MRGVLGGAAAGSSGARRDALKPALKLGELAGDRVDAEVVVLGAERHRSATGWGDRQLAAMAGLVRQAGVGLDTGEDGPDRSPPHPGAVLPQSRAVGVVEGLQTAVGAAEGAGGVVVGA